ncbi:hypothetical protein NBH00_08075 [Paraconexibacter antarcticus]|uniref:Thioesterase domain-containing protein n=1 Tax=Paraconexibacter antarcticus TaxID=2949664 RepID=A0ABY5DYX4_9ACTN|nr:hotdog domain-containing protein [Paraconexibacter antarcticus]UTI66149.1 hypothetical protein NBH00_08075 [Paraconexibacter antarcticus]
MSNPTTAGALSELHSAGFPAPVAMRGHDPMCMGCGPANANLNVDYRAPAFLGRELDFTAWCERIDGRKLHFHGEARQGDSLVAEARALFIHIDLSHWESSGEPLPDGWKTLGDKSR